MLSHYMSCLPVIGAEDEDQPRRPMVDLPRAARGAAVEAHGVGAPGHIAEGAQPVRAAQPHGFWGAAPRQPESVAGGDDRQLLCRNRRTW